MSLRARESEPERVKCPDMPEERQKNLPLGADRVSLFWPLSLILRGPLGVLNHLHLT